jgi:hypothetical protein
VLTLALYFAAIYQAVFISDIRNCKSKEAEIKRINKELANIRYRGDN